MLENELYMASSEGRFEDGLTSTSSPLFYFEE